MHKPFSDTNELTGGVTKKKRERKGAPCERNSLRIPIMWQQSAGNVAWCHSTKHEKGEEDSTLPNNLLALAVKKKMCCKLVGAVAAAK